MTTVTVTLRDGTVHTYQAMAVNYHSECIDIHEASMATIVYHWSAVASLRIEAPSA